MKMRTFIKVKTPSKSIKGTFHARYISERERDPGGEEPETRPLFTHDKDGIKYKAADRYLTGGVRRNARGNELQHVIIAFNSHDARELKKLEKAATADGSPVKKTTSSQSPFLDGKLQSPKKGDSSMLDSKDQSPFLGDSSNSDADPKTTAKQSRKEQLAKAHATQVARDRPYVEAVRKMMTNLENNAGLSDLRYVIAVHRHTEKTHVHLLLRREYADRETGEKKMLHRLPETFLNGLDEHRKAKAGLLDISLSDALDTLIPGRRRAGRTEAAVPSTPSKEANDDRPLYPDPDLSTHDAPELQFLITPRPIDDQAAKKAEKPRPVFVTPRRLQAETPATPPNQNQERHGAASSGVREVPLSPSEFRPSGPPPAPETYAQAQALRAANFQKPNTGLPPAPQHLKIEGPSRPPLDTSFEDALKKRLAARFAQKSPARIEDDMPSA